MHLRSGHKLVVVLGIAMALLASLASPVSATTVVHTFTIDSGLIEVGPFDFPIPSEDEDPCDEELPDQEIDIHFTADKPLPSDSGTWDIPQVPAQIIKGRFTFASLWFQMELQLWGGGVYGPQVNPFPPPFVYPLAGKIFFRVTIHLLDPPECEKGNIVCILEGAVDVVAPSELVTANPMPTIVAGDSATIWALPNTDLFIPDDGFCFFPLTLLVGQGVSLSPLELVTS